MGKLDIEEGWDAGDVGSKARSRPREWPVISRLVRWRYYDVAFGLAAIHLPRIEADGPTARAAVERLKPYWWVADFDLERVS
jgi:hypothetical protein